MAEIEALADDWFMHRADDLYSDLLARFIRKVEVRRTYGVPLILDGCIILMQTSNSKGRNHAGIVTGWPYICHCIYEGVSKVDASRDPMWSHQEITVYDPVNE